MLGGTKIKLQLVPFTFGGPALLGLALVVLTLLCVSTNSREMA